jgi:hypothetical protein
MIYITMECRMYNCLDGIKAWAPELHHGFGVPIVCHEIISDFGIHWFP